MQEERSQSPVRWGSRWPGPAGVEEHLQWCHWAQRFTLWQEKILEDRPVRIFNPWVLWNQKWVRECVAISELHLASLDFTMSATQKECLKDDALRATGRSSTHEYFNNANEVKAKHLFDSGLSETQSSRDEETTRVKAMSCQQVCGVWNTWLMGGGSKTTPMCSPDSSGGGERCCCWWSKGPGTETQLLYQCNYW